MWQKWGEQRASCPPGSMQHPLQLPFSWGAIKLWARRLWWTRNMQLESSAFDCPYIRQMSRVHAGTPPGLGTQWGQPASLQGTHHTLVNFHPYLWPPISLSSKCTPALARELPGILRYPSSYVEERNELEKQPYTIKVVFLYIPFMGLDPNMRLSDVSLDR